MRRFITCLFLALGLSVTSFAQNIYNNPNSNHGNKFEQMGGTLPTPNEYRTASGAPGPRYWQQRVDYDIKCELDEKNLFSHLSIKVNGKPVLFSYLGFENDKEAAYSYIEVQNVPVVNKLEVTTDIMYDQFDDQMNIMHVTVNGNRKSSKLNFPDAGAVFIF